VSDSRSIGVFDSGVGGLSVLKAMRAQLPGEDVLYFADQGHVPYGPRPRAQIQSFSESITRFLLERDCKLIVVACNTASAAALKELRVRFPETPFVGMEPALKPAAESTHTRKVGVLATPATFQGELYGSIVERFAAGVTILQDTCPGLVEEIEKGALEGEAARAILQRALQPMLDQRIDTVVLGCTHYPFVIPLIRELVGDEIQVIDPSPAVARQVGRVLAERGWKSEKTTPGRLAFYTSGDPARFRAILPGLLGETGDVRQARWGSDTDVQETGTDEPGQ
jgi:glutamate racemase